MFNISWQDLASETVAQHRERKERDERNSLQSSTGSSLRSVESSDSSRNPNKQALPKTIIGSSPKHITTPKRGISLLKNVTLPLSGKNPTVDIAGNSPDSQQTIKDTNRNFPDTSSHQNRDSLADTLQSASISQGRSNATDSSWSSVTDNSTSRLYENPPITKASFITRSREVLTTPQDITDPLVEPFKEACVSTERPLPDDFTIEIDNETFQFPQVPGNLRLSELEGSAAVNRKTRESASTGATRPGGFWKPPAEWECFSNGSVESQVEVRTGAALPTQSRHDDISTTSTRSTHQRREIRQMQAENPKTMLERIKERPTGMDNDEWKRFEFNKQLWMRTAIRYLAKFPVHKSGPGNQQKPDSAIVKKKSFNQTKALSLFESQASATFLAAFTDAAETHFVSKDAIPTCPILHDPSRSLPSCSIPHVYPLSAPNAVTYLPFESDLFLSIDSLNLPTLLPSASIPFLVHHCFRILRTSGTLHLTILDPMPLQMKLGPRLRTWIDKRLTINLEKNFRCVTPSRLIPVWLKEAGFSFSTTVVKIWANGNGKGDDAELSTQIGRMLWKELWTEFLDSNTWWWEDEAVMDECSRMETKWDVHLIVAMKK